MSTWKSVPHNCELSIYPDFSHSSPDWDFIAKHGLVGIRGILSEKVNLKKLEASYDTVILGFLNKVNRKAVEAGVLPDPITGKVGNMDANTMIEASNEMRRLGGTVILKAYARGDVTTAGPVRVRLEVVDGDE